MNSWSQCSTPLRTIARITAFSPGQSPPPVSTPIRIALRLAVTDTQQTVSFVQQRSNNERRSGDERRGGSEANSAGDAADLVKGRLLRRRRDRRHRRGGTRRVA